MGEEKLHPLLIRQLKRAGINMSDAPESVTKLVSAVNSAYMSSDQDKAMLERSIELSSEEIYNQNEQIRTTLESLYITHNEENKKLTFSELLIKHVEDLNESRNNLSTQAELLRQQAIELEKARDEAIKASRTKSSFLANMSHEIRTPINGIIGMLKVLQGTSLKNDQREYLDLATQSSQGLLSIIEDILDFSKIEAGKLDIENIEFKIRHVLKNVLATVYHQASKKGIELISNIDPEIPSKLVGDPNRLKQILLNLLGNAIKFTHRGYVVLTVKCINKSTGALSFSVLDTGIGIDEKKQASIFNPFEQEDASVTRKYGGTGLGLSISKQLIELLGGTLSLRSKVNVGSEFSFHLELPKSQSDQTLIHVWKNDYSKPTSIITSTDVLFNSLNSYLNQFSRNGVQILKENPQSISLHSSQDSEILFYDIQGSLLPKDKAAIAELASQSKKVILITSMFNIGYTEELLSLGINSILFKPFIDTDVINVFKQTFEPKSVHGNMHDGNTIKQSSDNYLRIAVVDDIHVNRVVAQKFLEQKGYDVICFESGEEILTHLKGNKKFSWANSDATVDCDLILLDIQMPGIDGIETCQEIRKWENEGINGRTKIPIVALTAHALKEDKERFIEAGMDDYLRKPIDVDALSLILSKFVGSRIKTNTETIPSAIFTLRAEDMMPQETQLIVDCDELLARFFGDWSIVKEIGEAYLEEEKELLNELVLAMKSEEFEKIRKAAHAIKGSLYNISGNTAATIAAELEAAAKEQSENVKILFEKFNVEHVKVRDELNRLFSQH